jgi:hypothetical protein
MDNHGQARISVSRERLFASIQEERLKILEGSWDEVDLGPHNALISALDRHLEGLGMEGVQEKNADFFLKCLTRRLFFSRSPN